MKNHLSSIVVVAVLALLVTLAQQVSPAPTTSGPFWFHSNSSSDLNAGENNIMTSVVDRSQQYILFGLGTDPGQIVKVRTSDNTRVAAMSLPTDVTSAAVSCRVPDRDIFYFATHPANSSTNGRIVAVDLDLNVVWDNSAHGVSYSATNAHFRACECLKWDDTVPGGHWGAFFIYDDTTTKSALVAVRHDSETAFLESEVIVPGRAASAIKVSSLLISNFTPGDTRIDIGDEQWGHATIVSVTSSTVTATETTNVAEPYVKALVHHCSDPLVGWAIGNDGPTGDAKFHCYHRTGGSCTQSTIKISQGTFGTISAGAVAMLRSQEDVLSQDLTAASFVILATSTGHIVMMQPNEFTGQEFFVSSFDTGFGALSSLALVGATTLFTSTASSPGTIIKLHLGARSNESELCFAAPSAPASIAVSSFSVASVWRKRPVVGFCASDNSTLCLFSCEVDGADTPVVAYYLSNFSVKWTAVGSDAAGWHCSHEHPPLFEIVDDVAFTYRVVFLGKNNGEAAVLLDAATGAVVHNWNEANSELANFGTSAFCWGMDMWGKKRGRDGVVYSHQLLMLTCSNSYSYRCNIVDGTCCGASISGVALSRPVIGGTPEEAGIRSGDVGGSNGPILYWMHNLRLRRTVAKCLVFIDSSSSLPNSGYGRQKIHIAWVGSAGKYYVIVMYDDNSNDYQMLAFDAATSGLNIKWDVTSPASMNGALADDTYHESIIDEDSELVIVHGAQTIWATRISDGQMIIEKRVTWQNSTEINFLNWARHGDVIYAIYTNKNSALLPGCGETNSLILIAYAAPTMVEYFAEVVYCGSDQPISHTLDAVFAPTECALFVTQQSQVLRIQLDERCGCSGGPGVPGAKTKTPTLTSTSSDTETRTGTLQSLTATRTATASPTLFSRTATLTHTTTRTQSASGTQQSLSKSLTLFSRSASPTLFSRTATLTATRSSSSTATPSLQSLTKSTTMTSTASASATASLQSLTASATRTHTASASFSGTLQSLTSTQSASSSPTLQSLTTTATSSASPTLFSRSATLTATRTRSSTAIPSLQSLTKSSTMTSTASPSPTAWLQSLTASRTTSMSPTLFSRSATLSATRTRSGTATPTLQSLTATATRTASPTLFSRTATRSQSATPTLQSLTATRSATSSPTLFSHSATLTSTRTVSSTASGSLQSLTPTRTASHSATPQSLTATHSTTASPTLFSRSATLTSTHTGSSTASATLFSLTKSLTLYSRTATRSRSTTGTLQSLTATRSATASPTLFSRTATLSSTRTGSATATLISLTATRTATTTKSRSASATVPPTATSSKVPTSTASQQPTSTQSHVATATKSIVPTATATPPPTVSVSRSSTEIVTATPTRPPTRTRSATVTPPNTTTTTTTTSAAAAAAATPAPPPTTTTTIAIAPAPSVFDDGFVASAPGCPTTLGNAYCQLRHQQSGTCLCPSPTVSQDVSLMSSFTFLPAAASTSRAIDALGTGCVRGRLQLGICTAPDSNGFVSAYVRGGGAVSADAGGSCTSANPFTGGCSCPANRTKSAFAVATGTSSTAWSRVFVTFCLPADWTAFWTRHPEAASSRRAETTCVQPDPERKGKCECPGSGGTNTQRSDAPVAALPDATSTQPVGGTLTFCRAGAPVPEEEVDGGVTTGVTVTTIIVTGIEGGGGNAFVGLQSAALFMTLCGANKSQNNTKSIVTFAEIPAAGRAGGFAFMLVLSLGVLIFHGLVALLLGAKRHVSGAAIEADSDRIDYFTEPVLDPTFGEQVRFASLQVRFPHWSFFIINISFSGVAVESTLLVQDEEAKYVVCGAVGILLCVLYLMLTLYISYWGIRSVADPVCFADEDTAKALTEKAATVMARERAKHKRRRQSLRAAIMSSTAAGATATSSNSSNRNSNPLSAAAAARRAAQEEEDDEEEEFVEQQQQQEAPPPPPAAAAAVQISGDDQPQQQPPQQPEQEPGGNGEGGDDDDLPSSASSWEIQRQQQRITELEQKMQQQQQQIHLLMNSTKQEEQQQQQKSSPTRRPTRVRGGQRRRSSVASPLDLAEQQSPSSAFLPSSAFSSPAEPASESPFTPSPTFTGPGTAVRIPRGGAAPRRSSLAPRAQNPMQDDDDAADDTARQVASYSSASPRRASASFGGSLSGRGTSSRRSSGNNSRSSSNNNKDRHRRRRSSTQQRSFESENEHDDTFNAQDPRQQQQEEDDDALSFSTSGGGSDRDGNVMSSSSSSSDDDQDEATSARLKIAAERQWPGGLPPHWVAYGDAVASIEKTCGPMTVFLAAGFWTKFRVYNRRFASIYNSFKPRPTAWAPFLVRFYVFLVSVISSLRNIDCVIPLIIAGIFSCLVGAAMLLARPARRPLDNLLLAVQLIVAGTLAFARGSDEELSVSLFMAVVGITLAYMMHILAMEGLEAAALQATEMLRFSRVKPGKKGSTTTASPTTQNHFEETQTQQE